MRGASLGGASSVRITYGMRCALVLGMTDTYTALVTRSQLHSLRREARLAGDVDQADLCTRALAGDAVALLECACVIREAETTDYDTTRTADGGLRYWQVYEQGWRTVHSQCEIPARDWPTVSDSDRAMFRGLPAEREPPVEDTDE